MKTKKIVKLKMQSHRFRAASLVILVAVAGARIAGAAPIASADVRIATTPTGQPATRPEPMCLAAEYIAASYGRIGSPAPASNSHAPCGLIDLLRRGQSHGLWRAHRVTPTGYRRYVFVPSGGDE